MQHNQQVTQSIGPYKTDLYTSVKMVLGEGLYSFQIKSMYFMHLSTFSPRLPLICHFFLWIYQ